MEKISTHRVREHVAHNYQTTNEFINELWRTRVFYWDGGKKKKHRSRFIFIFPVISQHANISVVYCCRSAKHHLHSTGKPSVLFEFNVRSSKLLRRSAIIFTRVFLVTRSQTSLGLRRVRYMFRNACVEIS